MNQYVGWREHGEEHPEWKQTVVLRFEKEIKKFIHDHWVESSKTRLLFGSMNADVIWEDGDPGPKDMVLTKRNISTLDPNFIPFLDKHILSVFTSYMEEIRTEARAILKCIYASNDENTSYEARMAGTEHTDYQFENFGKHLIIQQELRDEVKAKFAVIEYTRQRELYVQNLVHWEEAHKTLATEPVRGSNNLYNWVGKFRIDAVNILIKANEKALTMMKAYEDTTGKEYALYGQKYKKLFLDQQAQQIARVKTNFEYMTAEILFFDNPGDEAEGSPITQRVLDPIIAHIVQAGVPVVSPPPTPEFAEEVGFAFQYY